MSDPLASPADRAAVAEKLLNDWRHAQNNAEMWLAEKNEAVGKHPARYQNAKANQLLASETAARHLNEILELMGVDS